MRWSTEKRLQFIEFRLYWEGRINRRDLIDAFTISAQQASADIARYEAEAPGNMYYDRKARAYLRSPRFSPGFVKPDAGEYLGYLALSATDEPIIPWIGAGPPAAVLKPHARHITPTHLRCVIEAIHNQRIVSVHYQSMSTPDPEWRDISPHALGHDGVQWHLRAWCHRREAFRNFSLARILATRLSGISPADPETDDDWHQTIIIEAIADPGLTESQQRAIETEYGMKQGKLTLSVRRSFLLFALRRLGLDVPEETRPMRARRLKLLDRARITAIAGLEGHSRKDNVLDAALSHPSLSARSRRPGRR